MRPVRFVALSEDGHAFVLADEVGRLLALPIDDRVQTAIRTDPGQQSGLGGSMVSAADAAAALSPRDIQARIRAGESAEDVARVAGVPVDRVLRYAGPVLQERAMLAQHARRTRLKNADKNTSLAEVVDARLALHGVDAEKISWDAYRREDGAWRIVATWPSGKATASAVWDLDKTRQNVSPHDDMAQYLCADRPAPVHGGHDLGLDRPGRPLAPPNRGETSRGDLGRSDLGRGELGRGDLGRGDLGRGESGRGGHEPIRPVAEPPRRERPGRGLEPTRDPIRSGRDALLASLDRPLGPSNEPAALAGGSRLGERPSSGGGTAGSAFEDDLDAPKAVPAVPSLAVLRPRRTGAAAAEPGGSPDKPRKRLPSWDDVLFGSAPARESS
jgi:hypothetical protein